MYAYRIASFGTAPELVQIDLPSPAAGQVRLRIEACGLNFADLLMIRGKYQERPDPPVTLGMEMAGRVIGLGPGVTELAEGDRVAVYNGQGGLAEEANVPADRCVKLPNSMPAEDAAGFQVAYGTSHVALDHKARLQPGERLVVTGAAGGVGLTAVEIGAMMGAEVIAIARGADKLDIARQAGAAHLIDSESADIRSQLKALGGADVVYEAVGGELFTQCFRATNPDGRVLAVGFASGDVPQIPANHLLVKNISVMGLYWGGYLAFRPDVLTGSLEQLLKWYQAGKLGPRISHTLPLERVGEALDLLKQRKSTGKVVVTMT